jgi:uncharacterized protein (TIGR02246 family)
MKHSLSKWLTTFALLSINGLAYASTDEENIRALLHQYENALNASQTEKIMSLYGEQSVFMPQHAPAQIGEVTIEQAYISVFNTIKLNVQFTIHNVEIIGNTAWARTSSAGKTTILAANVVVTESNNELFIFEREQGKWKIHQYLFATSQPRS